MKTTPVFTRPSWAPAATLLVLSPLVVEVLFGATHLTTLFLLIPQICIYGGAALIIRTLVRRRQRSFAAILILGIAFAIAEECIILQTSVSPMLFGGDPNRIYSWAFGVNWLYLLWAVVYESVWAIVLPIQLTELIFPGLKDGVWLGRRGLAATVIAFMVASIAVWYRFTQVGILPGKPYEAPLPVVFAALAVIVVIVFTALSSRTAVATVRRTEHRAPRPWLVGLIAFGLALPWFILPVLVYLSPDSLPAGIPVGIGLAWVFFALLLVRRWSTSQSWQDTHRLAMIFGALMASMLAGFIDSGISLPIDMVGKMVFNGIALLLLIILAWRVTRQVIPGRT